MNGNAKRIWEILLGNGVTPAGAAGVLGNMEAESSFVPFRIQGDMDYYDNGYPKSRKYTAKVDSGEITKNEFVYEGPGGGGYGICQWTFWKRKENLYDFCKDLGVSIGDLGAQVAFFIKECQESYLEVWNTITSTYSVAEASDAVLLKFERPADMYNKRAYRTSRGTYYYEQLVGTGDEPGEDMPEESPEKEKPVASVSCPTFIPKPIRILKKGMSGNDVRRWQQLLKAAGFAIGPAGTDGIFGNDSHNATVAFQKSVRLKGDGVVGADTFEAMWRL